MPKQPSTRPSRHLPPAARCAGWLLGFFGAFITISSDHLRRTTGWRFCTFPAFIEEIELLGLKGKCFGPQEYANALAVYLDIEIRIGIVNDTGDPRAIRDFLRAGHTACLWYDERSGVARILVLDSLQPLEMTAAVYHELGHLAAGHSLSLHDWEGASPDTGKPLSKRLARQVPAVKAVDVEREARLREDFAMIAGALGPLCLEEELPGQLS